MNTLDIVSIVLMIHIVLLTRFMNKCQVYMKTNIYYALGMEK